MLGGLEQRVGAPLVYSLHSPFREVSALSTLLSSTLATVSASLASSSSSIALAHPHIQLAHLPYTTTTRRIIITNESTMITIGCSFGGLSSVKLATNSTATTTTDIPHLRFEHGDLVIKLDRDPSKWLVIHSKVFAVVSPVFAASASDSWKGTAQLDSIQHPDTGEIVEVRTLALKLVDDTYILEGKVRLLLYCIKNPR
jgi:hypothetical protein